jgi:uncharacterized protein YecE (DUF72 family)
VAGKTIPSRPARPHIHLGCAGWNLPRTAQEDFPAKGTHLTRYAARFPAVEINSSFARSHRPATYARWADSVPASFRFSVKLPRSITHEAGLADTQSLLDDFLKEATALGDRLGCLLIQLPPSLGFNAKVAPAFLRDLRSRHAGAVAIEPRHPEWFSDEADQALTEFRIARVRADPVLVLDGMSAGGWPGLLYLRLHGAPRVYYSSYGEEFLNAIAGWLAAAVKRGLPAWCIFDNTARGAGVENALQVLKKIKATPG